MLSYFVVVETGIDKGYRVGEMHSLIDFIPPTRKRLDVLWSHCFRDRFKL